LEQEGLDPQTAEELAQERDPGQLRERLEQEGVDPLEAQRLADEMQRQQQDQEAQREAQETAQELRESLEQAAEQAERESRPAPPEDSSSPGEPPDQEPRQSGPEDQGERQSGESGPQEPTPGPGGEGQQPEPAPGEQAPSGQNEQPGPGGESQGGQQPGEQQGAPAPGQPGPGQQGGEQPGGQQPGGESGAGDGLDRAQELAREMDRQGRGAAARSRQAEEFRRGAERLAGRQGGDQTGSEAGGPGDEVARVQQAPGEASDALMTDDLDVRRGADSTRAAAEVEAEGPARPGSTPTRADAARTLERAAPGAERALETQGVPSRFRDLVKRYFRQSDDGTRAPAPLAPTGDGDS
jgi:hypothetical protein